jgi:UMF2 family putative MFS family transporter
MVPTSLTANRRRVLAVLCLASAGWGFSFGLGLQLGSLWLHDAGCSAATVGLSTSLYYLGVAAASPLLPLLMRRSGRGVVVAGMIVDGLTTAAFPWAGGVLGWNLLRLLGGGATALCLIPMETRVNHNAEPSRRARDFGIYAFSVALGVGLGPVAGLLLYDVGPRFAFGLGGGVALAMAGLVSRALPPETAPLQEEKAHGAFPLSAALFSLATAWAQGALEGGMLTFFSPYLLGLDYTPNGASGLIAAMFLGVVLFQIPGAALADRLGRVRILLACHIVVLAGLILLPLCTGALALGGLLFVVGACCAALYPLGLALLGERVPKSSMATANAWYLACNCAGSLTGPWLAGRMIDAFGPRALFTTGAAVIVLVVGGWVAATAFARLRGALVSGGRKSPVRSTGDIRPPLTTPGALTAHRAKL